MIGWNKLMPHHEYFSTDYESARLQFQAACKEAGLACDSYENPEVRAPNGARLFADSVWAGREDAPSVLVTCSATHGVEGVYGSGCQSGWLREKRYRDVPDDVAVLHVHAINPYGFAWLRRVTEGNVDLNRNFLDHSRPPANEAYAEIHALIVPEVWDDDTPKLIQSQLARYVERRGQKALDLAVTGGQHTHPDGMFYGGSAPTWSNTLITRLARERLSRAQRVAVIDFHTGFQPYAQAPIICRHLAGSPAHNRARRWYGDSVPSAEVGKSGAPLVDGNIRMAFMSLCPNAEVTAIGIEVGTQPSDQIMMALYADNWLHLCGDPQSPLGQRIKSDMRRAFFPGERAWIEPVYARSMEIVDLAIQGLSSRSGA